MKKFISIQILACFLGLGVLFMVFGCKPESKAKVEKSIPRDIDKYFEHYTWADYKEDDVKYRVYFYKHSPHQTSHGAAVHVVNMTKEKLEVELLKKQLGSQVQKGVVD